MTEEIAKPSQPALRDKWTFRSLVAAPDVETGVPTGADQRDIAGLIVLFDVLIRCFSSLAYSLNIPPVVVAPIVCCLFVGMIVLIVILFWASEPA